MKNLLTLHNDSSFAVQCSNSVSKTKAILLFTIKIIEMFELHGSMPPERSATHQATIPLKFLIIIHNDANVQTINQSKSLPGFWVVVTSLDGINSWLIQTLLRGENDSKQSDEIQATRVEGMPEFQAKRFPQIIFHCFPLSINKNHLITNDFYQFRSLSTCIGYSGK